LRSERRAQVQRCNKPMSAEQNARDSGQADGGKRYKRSRNSLSNAGEIAFRVFLGNGCGDSRGQAEVTKGREADNN
jgi:hypothetical protein